MSPQDDAAAEIGARFHRWLTVIHCYPNGNGRHAALEALFDKQVTRPREAVG